MGGRLSTLFAIVLLASTFFPVATKATILKLEAIGFVETVDNSSPLSPVISTNDPVSFTILIDDNTADENPSRYGYFPYAIQSYSLDVGEYNLSAFSEAGVNVWTNIFVNFTILTVGPSIGIYSPASFSFELKDVAGRFPTDDLITLDDLIELSMIDDPSIYASSVLRFSTGHASKDVRFQFNNITVAEAAEIPIPAAFPLFLVGLTGLSVVGRRCAQGRA